jgi:hypothetical protein
MAPVTALSKDRATLAYRAGARLAAAGSVLVIVIALTMAWAVAARPAGAGPAGPRARGPERVVARKLPAAGSRQWRLSAMRHYGAADRASGFSAVVAPGPGSAWAFGGTNPGRASTPVALHWNGGSWQSAALPAGLDGFLGDASAPSARDIWAVSYGAGYVLHWNGIRWQVAHRWPQEHLLSSVTALSPADVWVFGTSTTGSHGMGTWHFNGRSWSRVRGLAGRIYRASAVSARDIWAVAATRPGGYVEHYDGRAWQRVPTAPAMARASLDDVLACSRHSVWIVGNQWARHGEGRLFLAHFDGRRWAVTITSRTADTGRLAADGSGGIFITADASGSRTDALAGHLAGDPDGHGRLTWSAVRGGLGSGISDIAAAPRSGRVWLSGGYLTRTGGNAAVWSRASIRAASPGADQMELRRLAAPLEYPSWRQELGLLLRPGAAAAVA